MSHPQMAGAGMEKPPSLTTVPRDHASAPGACFWHMKELTVTRSSQAGTAGSVPVSRIASAMSDGSGMPESRDVP